MKRLILFIGLACLLPLPTIADETSFERDVRPILKAHCFHCHGEQGHKEGGLDLRLVRLMKTGGDSGAAIQPKQAEKSLLYHRVVEGEMPPSEDQQLGEHEKAIIRNWINEGANTLRPEPESIGLEPLLTEEDRSHWAFQPVKRPPIPNVKESKLVSNPIDSIVLAKLEENGFSFSPRAAPEKLIRRLYIDLLGFPPPPEAVDLSARQLHPTAWNELVDETLASPHYGERWARHWLDVAGYADSEGYNDADAERPHAWRYRDYVIRSLNSDKPFHQFVQEQLAGDEMITSPQNDLSAVDAELLAATGFLRMAPDGTGGQVDDPKAARNHSIAESLKIVSSSLLGMTVGCAECHDHRYDPISQFDYYRFRAIFEPAYDWKQWQKPRQRLVSLYTEDDRSKAAAIEREARKLDANRIAKQNEFINATFEEQLKNLPTDIHALARETHKTQAKSRTKEQKALFKKHPNLNVTSSSLYLYNRKAADDLKKIAEVAARLRKTKPEEGFVRALTERPGRLPPTHVFARGDFEQPEQQVSPAGLAIISESAGLNPIDENSTDLPTSGRRTALARRLTDYRHPLTARVIVNRIWQHHFGHGLVRTPNDFGVLGQKPTHPELLDWLAVELMDHGWSIKHIHRLILTSSVWCQSVRTDTNLIAFDPDNRLWGGAELRRIDAEVIRDSILSMTGHLSSQLYGPPVPVMADRVGRFVIGKENLNAGRPGPIIDLKGEEFRRSVYIQIRRSRPLSLMEAFDQPAMTPNCDRRRPSTNATQSLMMLNSDALLDHGRNFASSIEQFAPNQPEQQVRLAWQQAYSRRIIPSEEVAALQLVEELKDTFAKSSNYQTSDGKPPKRSAQQEALSVMCQMLLASNEFLYLD